MYKQIYNSILSVFNTKVSIFSIALWVGIAIYSIVVLSSEYNHILLQQSIVPVKSIPYPDEITFYTIKNGTFNIINGTFNIDCTYTDFNIYNETNVEDPFKTTHLPLKTNGRIYIISLRSLSYSPMTFLHCKWNSTGDVNVGIKLWYKESSYDDYNPREEKAKAGDKNALYENLLPFSFDCFTSLNQNNFALKIKKIKYLTKEGKKFDMIESCDKEDPWSDSTIKNQGVFKVMFKHMVEYEYKEVRSKDLSWFWSQISPLSPFISFLILAFLRNSKCLGLYLFEKIRCSKEKDDFSFVELSSDNAV
jgi:hypothetical protein